MKKCKECLIEKSKNEFYGLQGECKECTKKRVKLRLIELSRIPAWMESERIRGRNKYRRLYVGKKQKQRKEISQRWINKYPEKFAAISFAGYKIERVKGRENHHWSYLEKHWLDVLLLTKKEHMKAHRFLIYDQERMMYRRYDTNELLDTKEKHNKFIINCIKTKED